MFHICFTYSPPASYRCPAIVSYYSNSCSLCFIFHSFITRSHWKLLHRRGFDEGTLLPPLSLLSLQTAAFYLDQILVLTPLINFLQSPFIEINGSKIQFDEPVMSACNTDHNKLESCQLQLISYLLHKKALHWIHHLQHVWVESLIHSKMYRKKICFFFYFYQEIICHFYKMNTKPTKVVCTGTSGLALSSA